MEKSMDFSMEKSMFFPWIFLFTTALGEEVQFIGNVFKIVHIKDNESVNDEK
jgi:hypothetical protein